MSSDHPRNGSQRVTWTRLLPRPRDEEMDESLRAEIRDPLWLLSRQWQMHEFRAEDAGSPVQVDLRAEHETVSRMDLAPGTTRADATPVTSYDDNLPLEALIEREDVMLDRQRSEPGTRRAAEAGLYFLRLLNEKGFTDTNGEAYAANEFPSDLRIEEPDEPLPQADRRYASLMAGRALDGVAVFRRLDESVPKIRAVLHDKAPDWDRAETATLPLPKDRADGFDPDTNGAFVTTAEEYVEWYCTLFSEPTAGKDATREDREGTTGSAWIPERLEYDATVAVGDEPNETIFAVPEYQGGHLDWDSFSVVDAGESVAEPRPSVDSQTDEAGRDETESSSDTSVSGSVSTTQLSALPTQITFPGMPVPRWWEIEDASSVLSEVSDRGASLSRLLPIEIAQQFSNDWFALPLDIPIGSFTRITALDIYDSFGVERTARPATKGDDGFELFMSDTPAHPEPGLFVPPTLGDSVTSDPIEDVLFARDEQANLAFGIERTVESAAGGTMTRDEFREPRLLIDDVVVKKADIEEDAGEISEDEATTTPKEYVTLTNPGDDSLDISGWRLTIESADGDESDTEFHDYKFANPLQADHSLRLIAESEADDAGHTMDETADLETKRVDFGAPLAQAASLSVYAPASDDPSISGDEHDGAHGRLVARRVLQRPPEELPDYRIATDVPDHWFPFEPIDLDDDNVAERLERSVLLDASTFGIDPAYLPTPRGEILDPDSELLEPIETDRTQTPSYRLYDEEIPPTGRRVTRNYQLARWIDGSTHLWVGRRVTAGRGEALSGLEFDVLEQPDTMTSGTSSDASVSPKDLR